MFPGMESLLGGFGGFSSSAASSAKQTSGGSSLNFGNSGGETGFTSKQLLIAGGIVLIGAVILKKV